MDRTDGTQGQPEQGGPAAHVPAGGPAGSPPAPLAPARIVTLTAGDFTLTVNPVDGSEIEPLRPTAAPAARRGPAKRDAASRAARDTAARPPALPGPPVPALPLLGRAEERERIARLLGRGRSVRLTGPAGSGRSALLDLVARDCAGLAPDGVVRLSGYGLQQPAELLYALYAAVYEAPDRRPDRTELLARAGEIGAVVLLDDLELGGAALDELLRATPECAYLLAAAPDTKSPSDDTHLEEVFLGGLGRADCAALLEAGTGRPLTDEETAWAGDLRFASEGLPLRFVQAAALLRQRDEINRLSAQDEDEEPGVFEERPREPAHVPLPTLAEGAAPAELLASRVSESARAALRIACALGGELPHHAHLPALVGDTHADSAVAELLGCGLITPVGPRHRLAEGVARQLEEAGYGDTAAEEARTAARHYAWWTGHASVTPERVAAEADAVLAALAGADVVAAVLLARTAAPAFAASLHWEAWERVLRAGAEAARKAGEVAEQAYFHHELGVLALCEGRLDRARAELEASIGLRGALADKRGTVAGRRALALVTDREALGVEVSPPLRLEPPVNLPGAAPGAAPAAFPGAAIPARKQPPALAPAPTGAAAPTVPTPLTGQAAPAAPTAPTAASTALTVPTPPVSTVKPDAVAPVAPLAPLAPEGSEAVTRITPVIGRQPSPASTPTTLSQVFEDAFPKLPQPAPPAASGRPEPEPAGRRKTVLLAAAGALTVVALGTVVGLALTSEDQEQPQAPTVSSTPDGPPAVQPQVPGGGGNDPAPEPGASSPPPRSEPSAPEPGTGQSGQPTPPARTNGPQPPPATTPPATKPATTPPTKPPASPEPPVSHPPSTTPTEPPPATSPATPPATSTAAQSPTAPQIPGAPGSPSAPTTA
ncbi:ATP-binding protein [Streptomyces lavendulae]|uniref:ATP-binding protein n=1 Tax=Streptomyces lavendulae TaxID=1914 RepID=UPI00380CF92C